MTADLTARNRLQDGRRSALGTSLGRKSADTSNEELQSLVTTTTFLIKRSRALALPSWGNMT